MKPRVLVVGDAGLDVVARHHGPVVHGGDVRSTVTLQPGGAGANTAAWLAHCGAEVVLVGRVGADAAGRQVTAELNAVGVRCAFTLDPVANTCCVVVLVDDDGQRTMLPDRGANARLSPDDLDASLLAEVDHLHLSGYVLLDPSSRQAGLAALRVAKEAGKTTSVDPQAAALIVAGGVEAFVEDIRGVDLLLPNTEELVALTGSKEPEAARELLGVVGAVAVTAGGDGASWVEAERIVSVESPRVECVDTTGAGDAFDAGLLSGWLSGLPPEEFLLSGVRAGATAVQHIGAQPLRP
ncbi:sugar kinase [Allokutzneria multivorans]|uniref:Sugar kinase n=1 Tax=Allokutzneria multivorans TaxID=1142134 RepID=A0ABP7S7S2_9PSEU